MKIIGPLMVMLFALLASCTMMAVEPARDYVGVPGNGDRYCAISGGFSERVCRYNLDELPELGIESAVMVQGYMFEDVSGLLHIFPHPDGAGEKVRLDGVYEAGIERSRVEAMLGRLVRVRGIYSPQRGGIQVKTLGWIDNPYLHGASPPEGFQLATNDESGERSCSVLGGTPHLTCRYRLEEIPDISQEAAGVRTVGYLLRESGALRLVQKPEGTGVSIPISGIRAGVIAWLPDALIEQRHPAVVVGLYHPGAGSIEIIYLGGLNLPGRPELKIPPPEER